MISIPHRALIAVTGRDALDLLQRLVTADLTPLQIADGAFYTLLLTPQGRVRFDFFVMRADGKLWLDAPARQATSLMAAMNQYKLRAEVSFEVIDNHSVVLTDSAGDGLTFIDSRHPALGWRTWRQVNEFSKSDKAYLTKRVACGVVEPADDLPSNATPLDYSLERLGAISFSKGCYLGQELTARMHNRDLAKYEVITMPLIQVNSEIVLAEVEGMALVQRRRARK